MSVPSDTRRPPGAQAHAANSAVSPSVSSHDDDLSLSADLKSAHRKLDRRLILWYSFVYLFMRIHVSNISNTAIINLEEGDGIKKQLGNLTSQQWAWVLSIFYYPYMLFEPIATLALKKFGPRTWMARIMVTWGIISMCQGATHNYAGILACRFFLGAAEAGFYPGVLYHMSFWFPTQRLKFRIVGACPTARYLSTRSNNYPLEGLSTTNSRGHLHGLLLRLWHVLGNTYAISFMNGAGGLAGWRWVFILEGLPAVLLGIYTFFFLPDYPENAAFLTEAERKAILADVPPQAPTMNSKTLDFQQLAALFRDPTLVPFLVIWITHGIGGFGITFVLPNVIYELGLTDTAISQLMTMPAYATVFAILLTLGWLTHSERMAVWVAGLVLEVGQIVCYILLITVDNAVAKYVFVCIATAASSSFFPIIWPERIRAVSGTTNVGLAIGMTNAMAQFSGIVGPQVYQTKFGPSYLVSYSTSIGLLTVTVIMILVVWFLVARKDKRTAARSMTGIEGEICSAQADAVKTKDSIL